MSYSDHLRNTPSKGQKAALRGTKGTPSATNRYVTDVDPRLGANPTNHHTTHEPGGDDTIELLKLHDTDPAAVSPLPSPMVNAAWLYRTGASPEAVEVHAYIDGILYTFPLGGTPGSGDVVLIEEQTPSGVSSISFSSLGSYTHLQIVYSGRGDNASTSVNLQLTFNGDSGNNYDRQASEFNATTVGATEAIAAAFGIIGQISAASAASGNAGAGKIMIPDYRGTSFHKTALCEELHKLADSSGNVRLRQFGVQWRNTNAITSLAIALSAGNFSSGSKFSLYGLN